MDLFFVIMESNDYMTRAINIDSILKKKKQFGRAFGSTTHVAFFFHCVLSIKPSLTVNSTYVHLLHVLSQRTDRVSCVIDVQLQHIFSLCSQTG